MRHVVIVGAMASGKTTLGKLLATELGRRFIDSDNQILERAGRTGQELAETEGVSELHRLEREVFLAAIASPEASVVAAAASVIEDEEVRDALRDTVCVWLTADAAVLARRSSPGGHRREVRTTERLERRDPLFEGAADLVIDTGLISESEAVGQVLAAMGDRLG